LYAIPRKSLYPASADSCARGAATCAGAFEFLDQDARAAHESVPLDIRAVFCEFPG
jgi:hypothetical protein